MSNAFIFFIVDHLNECPEELVPEQFIHFDQIIPISAKEKISTENVKAAIRETLYLHADRTLALNDVTDAPRLNKTTNR